MAVTFSSLSINNKNVHNRLLCWAITAVGIALQERKTSSATQLCKCIKEGKPEQQKDTVNHEDAPDNLNQSGELFPEAVVFLMFANHPIFQPDMPSSKSPSDSSSVKNTSTADNENESEDGEESTLRSRMTSKGLFKSRNTQRAEELKLGNKKSKSNVYSQDVIDLT
mmetsp:Transcript_1970/g.3583  ORF Transcript_1970/g.3583 Transcript_1970/m.3583 type:complete len:167 (+) Transcript_1970:57-557(+)